MRLLRKLIEGWYERDRDSIFEETAHNPELAHERFVGVARKIDALGLSGLLLGCPENGLNPGVEISNAAGFNKNALVPPRFMKALGFDRDVIGTITNDPWEGNKISAETPKRIWRYPDTFSMVNWLGLPGLGARRVAEIQTEYGNHGVPVTINFMSTPGKKGEALLDDLSGTIVATRNLPHVDTYQLNISCPNTHASGGMSREDYQKSLSGMIERVELDIPPHCNFEIKLSPDMTRDEVEDTIAVVKGYKFVSGFVTCNTTTHHDPNYISSSPGKGGASGDAVYQRSTAVQMAVVASLERNDMGLYLRVCGGIRSVASADHRVTSCKRRAKGIEIYTPLIMRGPRLLRELRAANLKYN